MSSSSIYDVSFPAARKLLMTGRLTCCASFCPMYLTDIADSLQSNAVRIAQPDKGNGKGLTSWAWTCEVEVILDPLEDDEYLRNKPDGRTVRMEDAWCDHDLHVDIFPGILVISVFRVKVTQIAFQLGERLVVAVLVVMPGTERDGCGCGDWL